MHVRSQIGIFRAHRHPKTCLSWRTKFLSLFFPANALQGDYNSLFVGLTCISYTKFDLSSFFIRNLLFDLQLVHRRESREALNKAHTRYWVFESFVSWTKCNSKKMQLRKSSQIRFSRWINLLYKLVQRPFTLLTRICTISKDYNQSKVRFFSWSHVVELLNCAWKQIHTLDIYLRSAVHPIKIIFT